MIDREIKKGELAKMASLSSNSISKLAKDENVSPPFPNWQKTKM